ncbi:hypothetical protein FPV67DRAFT_1461841 [Lyophyllum atratum]|nr:hypothetical protein FPV67DRAFT_1461841 [Lyophyllum atratum]
MAANPAERLWRRIQYRATRGNAVENLGANAVERQRGLGANPAERPWLRIKHRGHGSEFSRPHEWWYSLPWPLESLLDSRRFSHAKPQPHPRREKDARPHDWWHSLPWPLNCIPDDFPTPNHVDIRGERETASLPLNWIRSKFCLPDLLPRAQYCIRSVLDPLPWPLNCIHGDFPTPNDNHIRGERERETVMQSTEPYHWLSATRQQYWLVPVPQQGTIAACYLPPRMYRYGASPGWEQRGNWGGIGTAIAAFPGAVLTSTGCGQAARAARKLDWYRYRYRRIAGLRRPGNMGWHRSVTVSTAIAAFLGAILTSTASSQGDQGSQHGQGSQETGGVLVGTERYHYRQISDSSTYQVCMRPEWSGTWVGTGPQSLVVPFRSALDQVYIMVLVPGSGLTYSVQSSITLVKILQLCQRRPGMQYPAFHDGRCCIWQECNDGKQLSISSAENECSCPSPGMTTGYFDSSITCYPALEGSLVLNWFFMFKDPVPTGTHQYWTLLYSIHHSISSWWETSQKFFDDSYGIPKAHINVLKPMRKFRVRAFSCLTEDHQLHICHVGQFMGRVAIRTRRLSAAEIQSGSL